MIEEAEGDSEEEEEGVWNKIGPSSKNNATNKRNNNNTNNSNHNKDVEINEQQGPVGIL